MPQAKNQAQTPVIMQTRNELKTLFADNRTPSGNDFDTFIQSAIIQKDDGFTISPTNVLLDRHITLKGGFSLPDKFVVDANSIDINLPLTTKASISMDKTLDVDGLATLKGGLILPGQFSADSTGVTALAKLLAKDNLVAEKELNVSGQTTLADGLNVSGQTTLAGGLSVPGQFNADSITGVTAHAKLHAKGNLDAEKELNVFGKTTLADGLNVSGQSTLTGGLSVSELSTLTGGLSVPGKISTGSTGVTAHAKLFAKDNLDAEKELNVFGQATLADGLNVSGQSTLTGGLSVSELSTLTGGLSVPGKISTGSTGVTAHAKLFAKDNLDAEKELNVFGQATLADGLNVSGQSTLTGGLSVSELSTLTGGLSVPGKISTGSTGVTAHAKLFAKDNLDAEKELNVFGQATLADGLNVSGQSTLTGGLSVSELSTLTGGLSVPGQFNADSITGVTAHAKLHAKGNLDAEKELNVFGKTTLADGLNVSGQSTLTGGLSVSELSTLTGGLSVPGKISTGSTGVTAHAKLFAKDNLDAEKELNVSGKTTLAGGLNVSGQSTLTGSLSVPGQFSADSTTGVTALAKLHAKDNLDAEKELNVFGKTTLAGGLSVSGQSTLHGGLTLPDQFTADSTGITAYQPFTAKGSVNIDKTLTVSESAKFNGGLIVPDVLTADQERVNVNKPLHITQDKEQAPLKIHDPLRNCTPLMLTAAGDVGINTDAPNAQLHVVAPTGHDALRLEHRAADGSLSPALLITPQGQLALGRSIAEFKLDIAGNARISQELKLDGPLNVIGMATLKGGLTLPGQLEASASSVLIHKPLEIKDNLLVSGSARFDNGLTLPGQFEASAAGVSANKLLSAKNGLVVEGNTTLSGELTLPGQIEAKASGLTLYKPLLVKDSLEISKTLAVTGLSTLNGGLKLPNVLDASSNGIVLDKELTAKALSKLQGGLSLTQGGAVHRISNNPCLDKDLASDDTLATQLAVKSYVDTYASPFGRGGNTYAIHTQAEFDAVFGNGSATKIIPKNTTIMILPPRDNHHSHAYTHTDGSSIHPDCDEWKSIVAYELKNAVSVHSGVTIQGFNAETTRIVKKHEDCRFLIEGNSAAPVQNIRMEGFTFDGGRLLYQGNGGAVYLNQAKDIVIDAVLIGHQVSGLGGALYGEINVNRVTARNIFACQARNTDTRSGKGGAAFGLRQSEIHASNCFANFGGAIAECHTSLAKASNCQAQLGGAAYQCQKLTLNARDCRAHWHGGGAYECAYLIANGHWEGNRSRYHNTQHIAAHTNSGGFMWRGDFIGNWVDTSWSYQNI